MLGWPDCATIADKSCRTRENCESKHRIGGIRFQVERREKELRNALGNLEEQIAQYRQRERASEQVKRTAILYELKIYISSISREGGTPLCG